MNNWTDDLMRRAMELLGGVEWEHNGSSCVIESLSSFPDYHWGVRYGKGRRLMSDHEASCLIKDACREELQRRCDEAGSSYGETYHKRATSPAAVFANHVWYPADTPAEALIAALEGTK